MDEKSAGGNAAPIRVAIVEDRREVREGLACLIGGSIGYRCETSFADAESALARIGTLDIDVILMDIGLPGMSGIEAVRILKAQRPEIQVMMLTVYEDDDRIVESLRAGATGYVLKKTPPTKLLSQIASLHAGGSPMSSVIARRVVETFRPTASATKVQANLTPRESETLHLLAQGYRYREIAETLHISLDTVRSHIRHIYEKLEVRSRTAATLKYLGHE